MRVGVISRFCLSRRGLCALLTSKANYAVVVELPGIPEDMDILGKEQPDVLLFHACSPVSDLETVSRLHKLSPKIKVLLILDQADEETEFQAVRAGARGCVSRATDLDTLCEALDVVRRGEIWASRHVVTRLIGRLVQSEEVDKAPSNGLTRREWAILTLLASGYRNKEIANRLSISENTVKTHLSTIYRKIEVNCRLAATLYYFHQASSGGDLLPKSTAIPEEPMAD
jgi:DNA-binding NarL/FixJ family response regulator